MSDKVFVDTNVLLYARDARQPAKQPLASHWLEVLWRERRGCLSFQVLQEYYVNLTQKLEPGCRLRKRGAMCAIYSPGIR